MILLVWKLRQKNGRKYKPIHSSLKKKNKPIHSYVELGIYGP